MSYVGFDMVTNLSERKKVRTNSNETLRLYFPILVHAISDFLDNPEKEGRGQRMLQAISPYKKWEKT